MFLNKDLILKNTAVENLNTPDEIIGHSDEVHDNTIETLTQKEWLCKNIPFIETPDALLDKVYYYRWKNLLSCLSKRRDGKWELCESAPGNPWYHKYIDCAQGAHVREARWIRDTRYLNDYIDITPDKEAYWNYFIDSVYQKYLLDGDLDVLFRNFEKLCSRFNSRAERFDGEFKLYYTKNDNEGQEAGINGFEKVEDEMIYSSTCGITDCLHDNDISNAFWSSENSVDSISVKVPLENFCATGLRIWFKTSPTKINVYYSLKGEEKPVENLNVQGKEITFDKALCDEIRVEFEGHAEVFELVVCYTFEPWGCDSFWKIIGGDDSYRINANSFMAAAGYSLSKIAKLLNLDGTDFKSRADEIKNSVFEKLWDEDISFFREITCQEKKKITGRESNSYSVWSFNLAPDREKYAKAWKYALSEDVFLAPFGLTSLEKSSPHYMQPFGHGCLWNGPVWPYTFSMILTGFANLLHDYKNHSFSKDDYFDLLKRYCKCHFENFSDTDFAVRENHHPDENHWLAQTKYYNHSTFIDNVLNGLLGIRPTETSLVINPIIPDSWDFFAVDEINWRGHNVTVIYDKTGKKYNLGKGLQVFVDGEIKVHSEELKQIKL